MIIDNHDKFEIILFKMFIPFKAIVEIAFMKIGNRYNLQKLQGSLAKKNFQNQYLRFFNKISKFKA